MTQLGPPAPWLERDSEAMLAAAAALPDQVSAAIEGYEQIEALRVPVSSVVVFGMGASALPGAVLQCLASRRSGVPVVVTSGYDCPSFVGPGSLVFAVSFSGDTEETLEATAASLRTGAHVVAVTGGGQLEDLVAAGGGSILRVPRTVAEPRAGIGAMVTLLLMACEQSGLLPGARAELEAATAQLRTRLPSLVGGSGEAVEIARRIGRTVPLVHGAAGLGAVAARRWKTQVNTNAKAPSFNGEQPEVCHSEICGFGQHGDVTRQVITLVCLHLEGEDLRVTRRFELFAEAVSEAVSDVVSVLGRGQGELACFFDLVAIGDVMSLHLAGREGTDPGPVPVLADIKSRLRERKA
ncbi:MAG: SIS domain-containing protein [Acidimicrobiales bacterium]